MPENVASPFRPVHLTRSLVPELPSLNHPVLFAWETTTSPP
ncbi:hypothetical protein BH11ACT1_BH11ACT1_02920 [soil metagenome]